jgi:hypothetical protein
MATVIRVRAIAAQSKIGNPKSKIGLRRCALHSKRLSIFRSCASWKTPTIPSKMRSLLQDAHVKLSLFAELCGEAIRPVVGRPGHS